LDSEIKAQWSGKSFIELPEKQFLLPIVIEDKFVNKKGGHPRQDAYLRKSVMIHSSRCSIDII